MIRALVFDFDGVIVETESAEYDAWQTIYSEHGAELALQVWIECIGRGPGYFDPFAHLEELIGRRVDRDVIAPRQKRLWLERANGPVCPGVADYVADARGLGLKLGIASSSSRKWVTGHLERVGLGSSWDCIRCRDDVREAKPAPDLYLSVLEGLEVVAAHAVAIEDSANGIAAAKAAGLRCVAVPGPLTRATDLGLADLRLASLDEMPLSELLGNLGQRG